MCVHVHVGLLYRQDVSSLGDLSRCLIFRQGESCVYCVHDVTCVNVCVGLLYRQDVSSLGDLSRCLIFRQGESCVYRVRDVTCAVSSVLYHACVLCSLQC